LSLIKPSSLRVDLIYFHQSSYHLSDSSLKLFHQGILSLSAYHLLRNIIETFSPSSFYSYHLHYLGSLSIYIYRYKVYIKSCITCIIIRASITPNYHLSKLHHHL
jgi:hypothetical protein